MTAVRDRTMPTIDMLMSMLFSTISWVATLRSRYVHAAWEMHGTIPEDGHTWANLGPFPAI